MAVKLVFRGYAAGLSWLSRASGNRSRAPAKSQDIRFVRLARTAALASDLRLLLGRVGPQAADAPHIWDKARLCRGPALVVEQAAHLAQPRADCAALLSQQGERLLDTDGELGRAEPQV